MPGSKTIVIQPRDERLLRELVTMRVVDREQASLVAGFRSVTRANTRLLRLTRAGFLARIFIGTTASGRKALYTLTKKGAAAIGSDLSGLSLKSRDGFTGNLFLEHQGRINEAFLAVKHRTIPLAGVRFRRWVTFRQPISQAIPLKPDGYFEIDTPSGIRAVFLEVDLGTEAANVWEKKVQHYLQLAVSGEFTRRFALSQFRVLALTTAERRLGNLRRATARTTDKLFWFSTFQKVNRSGLFAAVWLRPTGELHVEPL